MMPHVPSTMDAIEYDWMSSAPPASARTLLLDRLRSASLRAAALPAEELPKRAKEVTLSYRTVTSNGYGHHGMTRLAFKARAESIFQKLEELHGQFDAVAVRGSSGLSMAFACQMIGDMPFVMVRKDNEESHGRKVSGICAECQFDVRKFIFLDDFVDSGETKRAVCEAMYPAKCIGTLTYDHGVRYEPHA